MSRRTRGVALQFGAIVAAMSATGWVTGIVAIVAWVTGHDVGTWAGQAAAITFFGELFTITGLVMLGLAVFGLTEMWNSLGDGWDKRQAEQLKTDLRRVHRDQH